MSEVSVIVTLSDKFTPEMKSMANTVRAFSKEIDGLGAKLKTLKTRGRFFCLGKNQIEYKKEVKGLEYGTNGGVGNGVTGELSGWRGNGIKKAPSERRGWNEKWVDKVRED